MGKEKADQNINVTEVLNIQILQDTIKALEETKLKLLLTIKELKDQLQQQKDDQADIYYYLNKKCDESFEVIASLEEQLSNEQSDREVAERMYENKIDELKTNYGAMETKLNAKIGELENKLEMMNKYGESKDEMERTLNDLMNKLDEERKQFRLTAENMENKFLLEREKLRKTYEMKYENMKKELEGSIDGKISKKTQRTQIMNAVIRKELDTQSKHADRLLEINGDIVEKDKQLKIDLDLAKSLQEELTKQLAIQEKTNKKLKEDLETANTEKLNKMNEYEMIVDQKNQEIEGLNKTVQHFQKKTDKRNRNLDDMWDFLSRCYQHAMKMSNMYKEKSSSSMTDGLSRVSTAASSLSMNGIDPNKPIMNQHEDVLKELIKQLAIKFPTEVKQYLRLGKQIADRKRQKYNKSGIASWDANTEYDPDLDYDSLDGTSMDGIPLPEKYANKMVQTEEAVLLFPSDSMWLNHPASSSMASSYSPNASNLRVHPGEIALPDIKSAPHSPIPPSYALQEGLGGTSRPGRLASGGNNHNNDNHSQITSTTPGTSGSQQQQPQQQRSTYTRPFKFIDINKWDSNQSVFSQDSMSILSKSQYLPGPPSLGSLTQNSIGGVHSLPAYIQGGKIGEQHSLDSLSQNPQTVAGMYGRNNDPMIAGGKPKKSFSRRHQQQQQHAATTTQSLSSVSFKQQQQTQKSLNHSLHDDSSISMNSQFNDFSIGTKGSSSLANNNLLDEQQQQQFDQNSSIMEENDSTIADYDDSTIDRSLRPINYYELHQNTNKSGAIPATIPDDGSTLDNDSNQPNQRDVDSISIAMSTLASSQNTSVAAPPPNAKKITNPLNIRAGAGGGGQGKSPMPHVVINSRVKYMIDNHSKHAPPPNPLGLGISPHNTSAIVSQLIMSPMTNSNPPHHHQQQQPYNTSNNSEGVGGFSLHSNNSSQSQFLKDSVDNALEMSISGKKYIAPPQQPSSHLQHAK